MRTALITPFLPVSLALVLILPASAAGTEPAAFYKLERDIPSLYLLNGLFLAKEQNDRLAALLEKASAIEGQAWEKIARLEKQSSGDLTAAATREIRGKDARSRIEGLRESGQEMREVRQRRQQELDQLSRQAYEILTPAQKDIVGQFQPCFIPAQDFRNPVRVGQAAQDTSFGEHIFATIRDVHELRLQIAREWALDEIVGYVMQKRYIPYSEQAELSVISEIKPRLEEVIPKIRDLSDVDYELEKADLVHYVVPLEGGEAASGQMDSWKIGHYLLNPGVLDVVRSRGSRPADGYTGATRTGKQQRPANDAEGDFRAARLVMGLRMTPSQAQQVLPVVREAVAARRKIEEDADWQMGEAITYYTELRQGLASQAPTAQMEDLAQRHHVRMRRIHEQDFYDALKPYENQIDTLLTADQVARLSGRDPRDREAVEKPPMEHTNEEQTLALATLGYARQMGEKELAQKGQGLAEGLIDSCLKTVADGRDIDRASEAARIAQVLTRARTLNAREYAAARRDLAVELCPRRSSPREVTYSVHYDRGEPVPTLDRTSMMLFTDAAVQVLEKLARR